MEWFVLRVCVVGIIYFFVHVVVCDELVRRLFVYVVDYIIECQDGGMVELSVESKGL